jgi:cobalt/nickel transport system ATP-binding protein
MGRSFRDCLLIEPPKLRAGYVVIVVENLHYRYGSRGALEGVSLRVEAGERVALLGANGAGKSTLLLCLAGLLNAHADVLTVAGLDLRVPAQRRQLPHKLGIVFQDSDDQLFNPTVLDDVAFGPLNLGLPADEVRARVAAALADVGMTGQEDRVPHQLSGGEKRRVALAGVLAMRPEVLLLDEPTLHLDQEGKADLIALLCRWPGTLLLASHDPAVVETICGRTLTLEKGRLR